MNRKRIFALAFAVLMVLALAACGMKNNDKMGDMSGNGSAMTGEPKNADEALALHKELLEQENAILSENSELWEKVFTEADKGMAMIEDGKNYGDFLLDTVEAAKEHIARSLAISSRQPLCPQVSHFGPLISTTIWPASPVLAFSPVIIRFFTSRGHAIP